MITLLITTQKLTKRQIIVFAFNNVWEDNTKLHQPVVNANELLYL